MSRLSKYTKARLSAYFHKRLHIKDTKKGWMKTQCPYCGREDKYGINISHNRTHCFRCGQSPTPISLLMYLEDFQTYTEVRTFLQANFEDVQAKSFTEEEYHIAEQVLMDLPEGYIRLGSGDDSEIGRIITKYVEHRGFAISYVRRMGWGYCTSGPLFGHLILPYFEQGKLIYYNARRVVGTGPRYNNPNTSATGIGKGFILYNADALVLYDKVYVCEGVINATTLSEQAISSGGKHLSRYQINQIITSPVEKVVIVLDPDAMDKAIDVALQLYPHKKVKVVQLPTGKDVNDIGRVEAMKIIRSTPYLQWDGLMKLKHSLNNARPKHTYNYQSI